MKGLEQRVQDVVAEYALPILRWLGKTYGPDVLKQAWREFRLRADVPFTQNDPHTELFFSWMLHSWSPSDGAPPPTRQYLTTHQLDPLLTRYLEACLSSTLAFYEVTGANLKLRHLASGIEYEVNDEAAAVSLKVGDVVFARVVTVRGVARIDAISPYSLPRYLRPRRTLTRKAYFRLLERYLATRGPQVRNGDTDLLEPQTLYFVIDSAQAAFDHLAPLARGMSREELLAHATYNARGELREVLFPWAKGDCHSILGQIRIRGRQLTVEVDSDERAGIFRAMIERTPGARARYTTTRRRRT
jgi:hypothetical protein